MGMLRPAWIEYRFPALFPQQLMKTCSKEDCIRAVHLRGLNHGNQTWSQKIGRCGTRHCNGGDGKTKDCGISETGLEHKRVRCSGVIRQTKACSERPPESLSPIARRPSS
jgi:hypothetical protein